MKRAGVLMIALATALAAFPAHAEPPEQIQAPRGQEIQAPRDREVQAPRGEPRHTTHP